MISRKFAYADDLALLHTFGNWKDLEGTLSQDISTLSAYFQTWRLKISHTKRMRAAFHLNNREGGRQRGRVVGSVVEWLKHQTDDQHGLGSKPTCAILLCSWERHFTALSPAWLS